MSRTQDLTGQQFGRLTVLHRNWAMEASFPPWRRQTLWVCLCSCGAETTVPGTILRQGRTRSCGCLRAELASARATAAAANRPRTRSGKFKSPSPTQEGTPDDQL